MKPSFTHKSIIGSILGAVLAITALNMFTYVSIGEAKVEACLGEVTEFKTLENGLHFWPDVSPYCSYDNFNTQNQVHEWTISDSTGVKIQTQDRMDSSADLKIKFKIKKSALPTIREKFGNETLFLSKTLLTDAPKIILEEGRRLSDSAFLAKSEHTTEFTTTALNRLNAQLGDYFEFEEVILGTVQFDNRVAAKIKATLERDESVKEQESTLRIKKLQLSEATAKSEEAAKGATFEKTRRDALADAKYYEAQKEAEALAYTKLKEAEGIASINKELSKSGRLVDYMDAQARLIEAQNWDGERKLTTNIFTNPITNLPVK